MKTKSIQTGIAVIVGAHRSIFSHEARKNQDLPGHRPQQAQIRCDKCKWHKVDSKFTIEDRGAIERRLNQQWNTEQLYLWLKQEGHKEISHETIYQHILQDQALGRELHELLREPKNLKRKRYCGDKDTRRKIPKQTSIEKRPTTAEQRDKQGNDRKGDSIIDSRHKQTFITMTHRVTRMTLMPKVAVKTAEAVTVTICELKNSAMAKFPTITFNNCNEYGIQEYISAELGGMAYFAHPYTSWKRGTNENTNGLVKLHFPKDCDFNVNTDARIQNVQNIFNNRPNMFLASKHRISYCSV